MIDKAKNGGPAFPKTLERWNGSFDPVDGMSLRDYFASKAMNGICSSDPSMEWTDDRIAKQAYLMADAMLAEREKVND